MQLVVASELGAIVKGDGLTPRLWQWCQDLAHGLGYGIRGFAGWSYSDEQTGVTLMQGEDGLAVCLEQHQVGLPVPRCLAVTGLFGPLVDRTAKGDKGRRASSFATAATAFELATRQIMTPSVIRGAVNLGVDETVDGLVGYHRGPGVPGETSCNLFGGPTLCQS
jgi:hypothetical protein